MKYLDPSDQVLFPVIISVRVDTANLLMEMASELGVSIDEILSAIAEDSSSSIIDKKRSDSMTDVIIPDKCSLEDLMNSLDDV